MEIEIHKLEGSLEPRDIIRLGQLKKLYNSLYPTTKVDTRKFCKFLPLPPPKTDK